jgi:hypothetical protein
MNQEIVMKNLVTVLFAGAAMATVAFAQSNNWANDINRAKLGRDLPYVEQAAAADPCDCGMPCCNHANHKTTAAVQHNDAALRAELKTGRKAAQAVDETTTVIASAAPVHNDAAERASLKTGRRAVELAPVEVASECVRMGCCKS